MKANNTTWTFSSESVSEGHPDKVCDAISDSILDACLRDDPASRVACESFATTGIVVVGGEITTETYVDIDSIVRNVVQEIGYDKPEYGFDCNSMAVVPLIHNQSADISQGVTKGTGLFQEQGAGDQGLMFGYACNETDAYMPSAIYYAHQLTKRAAEVRKSGELSWMRPDAKAQVTLRYEGWEPKATDVVVFSQQHNPGISYDQINEDIKKHVILPVFEASGLIHDKTEFFINPTGSFVIGGPQGDSGLTGRKIIVDTYGGMGRHGGGAFSGKDPSKVDRTAAYMARYVAKNIVAAGLADRCEIGVAYAIGYAQPLSIFIDCFGTNKVDENAILARIRKDIDFRPEAMIATLDLLKPIYSQTTNYGHMGKEGLSWEKLDLVPFFKDLL